MAINKKTYIIAGGGTGGHIYPGIAVAVAIQKEDPSAQVIFVGTSRGLETKIVPRSGYGLELIQVGQLNNGAGLLSKLVVLLRVPVAFWQSFRLLRKYQPVAVLGVGGYASGPFVLTASLMGYPTAIWEANAHPGLTNRWLSRFVRRAFLVFAEAQSLLGVRQAKVTGLPVRKEIETLGGQVASVADQIPFRILVTGGSQGARAINRVVCDSVLRGGEWLKGVHITHQTGSLDYADLKNQYKGHEEVVSCHEFLYDMDEQYRKADLVICRSGASTVTEIAACGKVAIFIPLPTAADNHQQKNAELFLKKEAGSMILQAHLSVESLVAEIQNLRLNKARRDTVSANAKKLFVPAAAEAMAHDLAGGLR